MSLFKKKFFKTSKEGNSSRYIIDFKNLNGSEHLSGLNDLNSPNNLTGLNDLWPLKIKNSLLFTY